MLQSIPDSIGKLKKLRILTIWWNELVNLPSQIGELTELEGLDLSANSELTELPKEITNLRNLKKLYLPAHAELRLTPEQKSWIDTLRSRGAEVESHW